ncbi:hypothetical protein [Streptomyces sp. NPDC093589]|uniref:hypothetical protein n=1 Tax=Streptomyces sp. NPDC093589 TaxID=3366043 RepID=UPI00382992FE
MVTTRDPAAIAYDVAEQVRVLTAATEQPAALPDVAAVRDVTEGLHLAVGQLPAVLEQLGRALVAVDEQQRLTPTGSGPEDAVSSVLRGFLHAREGLAVVRQELRAAGPLLALLEARPAPAEAAPSAQR